MNTHLGRAGLSAVEGSGGLGPGVAGGGLDRERCRRSKDGAGCQSGETKVRRTQTQAPYPPSPPPPTTPANRSNTQELPCRRPPASAQPQTDFGKRAPQRFIHQVLR